MRHGTFVGATSDNDRSAVVKRNVTARLNEEDV
jgi:hypothetical protein